MTCKQIEPLLPAYSGGDLNASDRARVDAHVGRCESCRESLDFWTGLETSLLRRREIRPSSARAANRAARRVGLRKSRRLSPVLGVLPATVSVALIIVGILSFVLRGPIQGFLAQYGGTSIRLSAFVDRWTRSLNVVTAGNDWTLLTIYLGLFSLIFLTGGWMVLRYVRD